MVAISSHTQAHTHLIHLLFCLMSNMFIQNPLGDNTSDPNFLWDLALFSVPPRLGVSSDGSFIFSAVEVVMPWNQRDELTGRSWVFHARFRHPLFVLYNILLFQREHRVQRKVTVGKQRNLG